MNGVSAELTLSSGPAGPTAHLVITNMGSAPVELDLIRWSAPSLALEIVDAEGVPVPLPPPPVPGGEPSVRTLEPGERVQVDMPGFLPGWTPSGTYRVRCRPILTPWVSVVVAGGATER